MTLVWDHSDSRFQPRSPLERLPIDHWANSATSARAAHAVSGFLAGDSLADYFVRGSSGCAICAAIYNSRQHFSDRTAPRVPHVETTRSAVEEDENAMVRPRRVARGTQQDR